MKKRLRKKLHRGEFAEWGCQIIASRNTPENAEEFQDAFLLEAIEGNGCYCGGAFTDDTVDVVVELGRMADDPESKRAGIATWLEGRPDVKEWKASGLYDLWHGECPDLNPDPEEEQD